MCFTLPAYQVVLVDLRDLPAVNTGTQTGIGAALPSYGANPGAISGRGRSYRATARRDTLTQLEIAARPPCRMLREARTTNHKSQIANHNSQIR
jgi:hypothetical protein